MIAMPVTPSACMTPLGGPPRVLCSVRPGRVAATPAAGKPRILAERRHAVPHRSSRAAACHATPSRFDETPVDPVSSEQLQVSSVLMGEMQQKIGEALQAQEVVVKDAYGDGRHVSIEVVSSLFEGKKMMERQRMVYKAIWLELQNAVHAVDAMTTKTPEEAAAQQ